LFIVSAADGAGRPLPVDGVVRAFRWGPGGERGVAIVERNGYHAWLLSSDGGVRRPLLSSPSGTWMGDLGWYPDGVYTLVRVEDASGATQAQWRLRVAGGDRATVPSPQGIVVRSALSGDGRRIAYIRGREGSMALWVGHADGRPLRRIAEARRIPDAAWSPQSDKIAYAEVTDDEQATIWITDADGTGRMRVSDYRAELADHGIEIALAWSPTGRALAFGTNTGRSAGPVWVAHLVRR
jgi:Tol biopolymer transport system component